MGWFLEISSTFSLISSTLSLISRYFKVGGNKPQKSKLVRPIFNIFKLGKLKLIKWALGKSKCKYSILFSNTQKSNILQFSL